MWLQGHRTYQTNHLVYPTDVVYPNVWTKAPAKALWMPSHWLKITFQIGDDQANTLKSLLIVSHPLLPCRRHAAHTA